MISISKKTAQVVAIALLLNSIEETICFVVAKNKTVRIELWAFLENRWRWQGTLTSICENYRNTGLGRKQLLKELEKLALPSKLQFLQYLNIQSAKGIGKSEYMGWVVSFHFHNRVNCLLKWDQVKRPWVETASSNHRQIYDNKFCSKAWF